MSANIVSQLLSREASNISIDEKSSTSSMNSSFNRLWNDNKSYFNRQQQLPKRPSYARQQLQPDWQEATLNKPILSTKSNKNVNYRQKRQLGLKDITPERELTPPSYDSKYYELPEPRSFMEKEFLEPAEDRIQPLGFLLPFSLTAVKVANYCIMLMVKSKRRTKNQV
jgi:hypothetical protein